MGSVGCGRKLDGKSKSFLFWAYYSHAAHDLILNTLDVAKQKETIQPHLCTSVTILRLMVDGLEQTVMQVVQWNQSFLIFVLFCLEWLM